jgi:hypothetical protein
LPGLRLVRGCANTAVFERNGRKLLIDPGELTEAPGGGPVDWVPGIAITADGQPFGELAEAIVDFPAE